MEKQSPECKRRDDGCFDGYRVNCELVPCLPARIVSRCLSDPRRVPYLLIWKHRWSGLIKEVVRLALPLPTSQILKKDWIEAKRGDGIDVLISLSQRPKGSFLICNSCQEDRRALYAWKVNQGLHNVSPVGWHCRVCAGLSYASEGGALVIRRLLPQLKPYRKLLRKPRPGPWEPLVFASPWDAMDAGLCQFNP
jgi:hypothetical protein